MNSFSSTTTHERRSLSSPSTTPIPRNKQDLLHVSSTICNSNDLGPFARKAFASGHPEILLHHLCSFACSSESEIEEVYCALLGLHPRRRQPPIPPL
ncbi:hypothetical protein AAC387_Pa04g1607 [Persea americana]